VAPVGGLVITGVGCVLLESVLLQAANNIRPNRHTVKKRFLAQGRSGAAEDAKSDLVLCLSAAPLRPCARNLFSALIINRSLIAFLRDRLTGHTILTLDPTAKINKLTAFRTERTDGIVFPLDWLTAGWTLHES